MAYHRATPQTVNLANSRNLTGSQNWPHKIKNDLFNYSIPLGRKLEILGSRKQMWTAQMEHMGSEDNIFVKESIN